MNNVSGPECSYQRDLSRGSFVPSSVGHLDFSGSFSDRHRSGPVQHRGDRGLPYGPYQDGSGYPGVDEPLRDDHFDSYRFYCAVSCDPSASMAQYSSVPYLDYLAHQAGPYHPLSSPPDLGENVQHTWTPEETYQCEMSSVEVREAVASISAEGAAECGDQACHRQSNPDTGQNSSCSLTVLMPPRDQQGEKLAVQTANMCQVVCNVNGGQQMVVLSHCSPNQMIHPIVLDHRVSSADPSPYTADHLLSSEHGLSQDPGDGVPVRQVLGGFSSSPYPSSFINPTIHPSSSHVSAAPGCTSSTIPASYVSQILQTPCSVGSNTVQSSHSGAQSTRDWQRSKKPCNCTKSQCLKLYCDCFANGEVCSSCNCINCCNNEEHESERHRAIKTCLERNPEAFLPKIGNRILGNVKNRQVKGCNCKRSGCLKNYCECYEARIMCSSTCKCVGCRNYGGSPVRQSMVWQSPETTNSLQDSSSRMEISQTDLWCPLSCITPDVVEATCGCLLAQAEEAEREGHTRPHAERMILEEFGQCLTQIVHSIFKSTGVQW